MAYLTIKNLKTKNKKMHKIKYNNVYYCIKSLINDLNIKNYDITSNKNKYKHCIKSDDYKIIIKCTTLNTFYFIYDDLNNLY